MTIRLLAARGHYPVNAIVTLDAGTEAGLVAAKLAEFNLTGGTPYVAPTLPNQRFDAQIEVDPAGAVVGLVADGKVIAIGGGYTPPISQYDRALIIPQIRQANAVKGLSRNINDAQYVGAITDAEVYDTEPGALSVGQATSKALAFHWGKMLWDLAAGESLLVQCRFKTVGATAGARIIFGNSNGAAAEGWNIQLYGPTDSGQAGRLILNYKTSTNASNRQLQPATVGNGSVGSTILPTDAWINLTMVIEGSTRRMDSWVNCQQSLQAGSILQPGSWVPAVKRNFGIGHAPTDDSFTTTSAQAVRIQTLRIAVLPAGQTFANPGWLDLQFNINPYRFFSDADYVGAVSWHNEKSC